METAYEAVHCTIPRLAASVSAPFRQKEPNSALHPRDTSEDHPEQDGLAQRVEERDEYQEKQRDTLSEQASTITVKHKDANNKLDKRARTAHENTHARHQRGWDPCT